jgi:LPXTG-motif cell wall-anchored protein
VYSCDSLTKDKISRTEYKFTGKATAEGGATIVSYTFDFDDGTTATVANPNDVPHTYAKAGTYTVKLSVVVKVNNIDQTITDATKCAVKVTVSPEECKPGVPVGDKHCEECKPGIPVGDKLCEEKPKECKPGIPMNDDRCEEVPAELPKTGAGENLVALIGAGSLIASIGYYIASRRMLS